MKQSKFIISLAMILLLGVTSCVSDNGKSKTDEHLPNVIMVLVDDLGYGDLSFYGQKTLSTPNLDRMAQDGIHFTNMYTGSSVCAPSRTSLMSGKHTGHTSVRGNRPDQVMGDDEYSIADVFKDAGYATAAIGKWGIGHPPPKDDPKRKGFDYFYGFLNMYHAHNFFPEYLYENGEQVPLNNKTILIDGVNPWADKPEGAGVAEVRNEYVHDLFDARALDFIENNKDQKFFLYLAYNVPHANNEGESYLNDGMEVDDYYEFKDEDWPIQEQGFAAMIRNLDNSMGMIRAKLEDLNIDKNTLVLFCSDNGPHQEGGHVMEFFNSNGELRGKKVDFYDGGIKTPFIAYWPETIEPDTKSDQIFAFWDFLPTFSDIVGGEDIEGTDGISFLPVLLGEEECEKHEYLYWELFDWHYVRDGGATQAIIKYPWKAIKKDVSSKIRETTLELYNLVDDPAEAKNVVSEYPEVVEEMNELFVSARTEFSITPMFE
ncbi:MAG: arylsulfatase [Bacteroidales bacterium]|jgi:arylsulfatase A-like enzyme|nr:arylsulfatase [Bacteroidales bacterium]